MKPRCEVCENFRPDVALDPTMTFLEVAYGSRRVALCRAHARIAENSGVTSFEELRELYGKGRRSFIPRRASDRESRTADRRHHAGRRATDRLL